ncbi:GIY-YIG nuclease family protein [Halobium salinum]|uniref:GIY-YIG nuclease family protein n=1 Tax=Halobium salinum TaxID=1364940 RepID=A0ABD5PBC6_9EURY|nr:hypothetical protein [Halobium salinum]
MRELDCYSEDWFDLKWSDWYPLGSEGGAPTESGLYRIRHSDTRREWLEYIGETGQKRGVRGRIAQLANNVYDDKENQKYAEKRPGRAPHTAAACMNAICRTVGPSLEVSFTTTPVAEDKWMRKGLEDALIALHRREIGHSYTAFDGRMIPGYEDWDRKLGKEGNVTDTHEGAEVLNWSNYQNLTSEPWMGLQWSEPRQLSELGSTIFPEVGVYRTWYRDYPSPESSGVQQPLLYIGKGNLNSRIGARRRKDGEEAMFSFSPPPNAVDSERKLREIEVELIGAHYVANEIPPLNQENHQIFRPALVSE